MAELIAGDFSSGFLDPGPLDRKSFPFVPQVILLAVMSAKAVAAIGCLTTEFLIAEITRQQMAMLAFDKLVLRDSVVDQIIKEDANEFDDRIEISLVP